MKLKYALTFTSYFNTIAAGLQIYLMVYLRVVPVFLAVCLISCRTNSSSESKEKVSLTSESEEIPEGSLTESLPGQVIDKFQGIDDAEFEKVSK